MLARSVVLLIPTKVRMPTAIVAGTPRAIANSLAHWLSLVAALSAQTWAGLSVRGAGDERRPAQHVARQVEVVCSAFGDHASLRNFDLADTREPKPWGLAPELKSPDMRPTLHWTAQEESKVGAAD